jgi:hypothetical protein
LTGAGVGTVASFIKLSRMFWPQKNKKRDVELKERPLAGTPFPKAIHLSLLLLALCCIAGGIFAPEAYGFTLQALGGQEKSFAFYSTGNLLKTLYTTLGGLALFLVVSTKAGKKTLALLRTIPHSFQDHFFGFVVAATSLVAWLYVH